MSGFLSPTATSSGRRFKRLDKTASLVGLKYVFISDCRWSRRGIACPLIVIRWCLGLYIVAMLLLIGPARDGRHNTYICRGSDLQIEPLGPDVFDVVSDVLSAGGHLDLSPEVLHSSWDKITVENRRGGFLGARGGGPEPLEPSPGYAPALA